MRVLALNLYYPPDTSATAKMAAAFLEPLAEHHEVTVVCGRPSYEPTERRSWRLWRREEQRGVQILRVGSTDFPRTQMTRRVLNYLTYVLLAVPAALCTPCDAVLAMTDPPFEGIVGAFVALLKRRPYIYNIRDLYPDMAIGGSIVEPGLLARVWERLHRWALRRAACVIVLGEDMRARIITKGVAPDRVVIVRDGAVLRASNASSHADSQVDAEVVRAIRDGFSFVLLHAGNLGFYGAWDTLLTAAQALEKAGVGFVFVGEGAQRARLQAAAADCTNIRFLPFFPAEKISSVLAAADAHIITVKRGLEGVVVPSKLYGTLAAGGAIVAVAPKETDVAALGARQGFAVSADPDKPEELISVIRALQNDPQRLAAMRAAALAAAPGYAREGEQKKFVLAVEQAVTATGAAKPR